MTEPNPCPLEVPPPRLECPAGCGYSTVDRWRMQIHALAQACRNRPKTVVVG